MYREEGGIEGKEKEDQPSGQFQPFWQGCSAQDPGLAPDFGEERHLGQKRNRKRGRKGRGWKRGKELTFNELSQFQKKWLTERFSHLFASVKFIFGSNKHNINQFNNSSSGICLSVII